MTLYKISAFSRLGQVSIKALRLYDQRDLLKPAQVDADSGYRYYRIEQLSRLHRILALKAMGLSLEQIGQLLNDALSLSQMQAMLRLKQAELQQQLVEAQHRLSAVNAHLKYLQEEQTMPATKLFSNPLIPSSVWPPFAIRFRRTIPSGSYLASSWPISGKTEPRPRDTVLLSGIIPNTRRKMLMLK